MSRIGRRPVVIPSGVTVTIGSEITVRGPKGQLSRPVVDGITVAQEGNQLVFNRTSDDRFVRARHGLMRALVNNMVKGVSVGFERRLELRGVGYKAEVQGKNIIFNLGYSHPIEYPIPAGLTAKAEKGTGDVTTVLVLGGIDNELLGQVSANLRSFRAPDSYKGKGVRYLGERVRLKAGKTAKK